jgi:hypothetical protein
MSDVLNLSPFGNPIPNPKKKYVFGVEEPQEVEKIRVFPKVVGDDIYLSSEVDSEDFDPSKIPGMIPQVGEDKTKEEPKNEVSKQNLAVVIVLRNQAQLKLLHWQTLSYAEHKALGKLYDTLEGMGDNLVEVIMGKYGRPRLDDATRSFQIENYKNPETPDVLPFLDHLFSVYQTQVKGVFDPQKDSEIINLIDGILETVDKTKYLITLRK